MANAKVLVFIQYNNWYLFTITILNLMHHLHTAQASLTAKYLWNLDASVGQVLEMTSGVCHVAVPPRYKIGFDIVSAGMAINHKPNCLSQLTVA